MATYREQLLDLGYVERVFDESTTKYVRDLTQMYLDGEDIYGYLQDVDRNEEEHYEERSYMTIHLYEESHYDGTALVVHCRIERLQNPID